MKKKKVIISTFDSLNNPHYGGGGAYAIHQVARRLSVDFSVEVVTYSYPLSKNVNTEGVNYRYIGLKRLGGKTGQLIYNLILPFYVLFLKYDLWIESFTPPFSVSFLPLLTGKPWVGLVHMLSASDMERKYHLPFSVIEKTGLKLYRNFIVLSSSMKKKIRMINHNAVINVIPNGIDLNVLQAAGKKKDKYSFILYLGRIEVNQKGLDSLLQAYKSIEDKTDLKLIIAGSGSKSEERKLEVLINELNLEKTVILTGRVEGKQKEKLFSDASLFILPSRHETFPITALEAMAYSLPLVGFEIEGLDWIDQECIVRVKPGDARALGKAILSLIQSPSQRKKMGQNGRKFVGSFDWETVTKKYRELIGNLLTGEEVLGKYGSRIYR